MDQYAPYVIAAYAGTALILGGLIWQSVLAARRARQDLERLDRERGR
ncbi:MAG: heme exporter protein CcmD [Pseudomonadota bacterium]